MLKFLFDANVVYDVILIIALALCVVVMIKTSWGKYFFGALIYVVLIGTAVYSAVEINDYNSASGGIFGQFVKPPTTNNLSVKDLEFNMDNIELTQKDASNDMLYEARFETDEIVDVTNYTKYGVFINDIPVEITEFSVDYLLATYEYNFYGENQELILNDTLKLKFAFYKQCSKFIVQSNGGSQAVKQWNDFFKKNSFVVTMKETETDLKQTLEDQLAKADFYIGDQLFKTVYVLKGNTIAEPEIDSPKYTVSSWEFTNGETVNFENIVMSENINFYAVFEIKIYTITVKHFIGPKDETEKIMTFEYGDKFVLEDEPANENYVFAGYSITPGNLVSDLIVTQNQIVDCVWGSKYDTEAFYNSIVEYFLSAKVNQSVTVTDAIVSFSLDYPCTYFESSFNIGSKKYALVVKATSHYDEVDAYFTRLEQYIAELSSHWYDATKAFTFDEFKFAVKNINTTYFTMLLTEQ